MSSRFVGREKWVPGLYNNVRILRNHRKSLMKSAISHGTSRGTANCTERVGVSGINVAGKEYECGLCGVHIRRTMSVVYVLLSKYE